MPFVARDAETLDRIDITRIENPRRTLQAQRLICQLCEERMIIRQGLVVRPHFAHTRACSMPYAAHPESPEHLLGKWHVRAYLRGQPEFAGTTIELEVPITARQRIADILVTFPQGHRLAVEIQLASITPGELEARSKDYLDDGIDVLWALGKAAAASPSNSQWCRAVLGGYLLLAFTEHHEQLDITLLPDDGAGSRVA
jgi:competence CoiA-like predicted nuclease